MAISKELLDILACPKCKGDIHYNDTNSHSLQKQAYSMMKERKTGFYLARAGICPCIQFL